MFCCYVFLLCFSHELDRLCWSRCSRAFVKAVKKILHTQFWRVLAGRWLIRKLETNSSSLKSYILIIRCDCLVVIVDSVFAIMMMFKRFFLKQNSTYVFVFFCDHKKSSFFYNSIQSCVKHSIWICLIWIFPACNLNNDVFHLYE